MLMSRLSTTTTECEDRARILKQNSQYKYKYKYTVGDDQVINTKQGRPPLSMAVTNQIAAETHEFSNTEDLCLGISKGMSLCLPLPHRA